MADSFQARFVDLVRNYTSTTGTSNFVLGAQVAGYRSFASEIQPGESFYYSAIGIDRPAEVEVGRGTMQADGTISREAMGGTLTNFSDGSKTVALVAAAEWFELAEAGASRAVASRADLAALTETSKPALLYEPGRAGLFVFDPSDLSAKVAADTQQGICIAPTSDPTGASGAWRRRFTGAIEARWFGAVGDGIADDTVPMQAALSYFETEGPGVVRLGTGTFSVAGTVWINAADVTVDAHGATVQSSDAASAPMMLVVGDRARVHGGTWKVTGAIANTRTFDFVGVDCVIEGAAILKEPEINGVHSYIRYSADGFQMRYCTTGGSDGIQCEASNCAFLFNHFRGQEAGGDDGLALKSIQEGVENIRIIGNHFEKLASFCSIGTQVGTHAVDDPDYTKFVRGVQLVGNSGKSCATMLYIKPGAGSGKDYRDGLVQDVTVSDNTLLDLDGIKYTSGLRIMADRGAKVRNVKGANNVVRARASGTEATGKTSGVEISVPGFGAAPTLSDIDLEFTFDDPYDGAANATDAPGYPVQNIVRIDLNGGSASDIRLRVDGNGCSESGIMVASGADDIVTIEKATIRNAATGGAELNGALRLQSRVRVADSRNLSLSSSNGNLVSFDGGELVGCNDWTPNFTGDGDIYIPADTQMTVAQGKPQIGTGTLTYEKSTAAAPGAFETTQLPATLEPGSWLKVNASGVAGFCATQLIRIA